MIVTRSTPGGFDQYGDPLTGVTTTHEIDAVIAPETSTSTDGTGRAGVVVGLTLYSNDPNADIQRGDLVEYLGEVWSIDGEVGVFESPYGPAVDGIQVALKRGQG